MWAATAKDLLDKLDPNDTRIGKVRFPYAVGLLARGPLADAVAYGRSLGLDIQVHRGGGWLVQRGFIVTSGDARSLCKFIERLAVTIEWSEQ